MSNSINKRLADKLAGLPNLALTRLGAKVIEASDDFFAPAKGILKPQPAVFIPEKFTPRGKWMDGWETRRRRSGGHDHLILQLGSPGLIHGIEIDTSHYTGNYPEQASIEVSNSAKSKNWVPLITKRKLKPDNRVLIATDASKSWKYLRLQIFPDGGIARLRVYGTFERELTKGKRYDLANVLNGASIVSFSDQHFGAAVNMLLPDKGINMGDGWETRRSRTAGHLDWVIIKLAGKSTLSQAVIDTAFFKGNFPHLCSLQAANVPAKKNITLNYSNSWATILKQTRMKADSMHKFSLNSKAVTHVRLNLYPDGGVSRLRLFGNAC